MLMKKIQHLRLEAVRRIKEIKDLGIEHVILFGIPHDHEKDACGSEAYNENGIIQRAVRKIKEIDPDMNVVTDVCMCEYTSHGHCGILTEGGYVDNDKTLEHLAQIAVSHVKAGAEQERGGLNKSCSAVTACYSSVSNGISKSKIILISASLTSPFNSISTTI